MKSKSTDRRGPAVIAETADAKAAKAAAKGALPSLNAYALIKNPSSKQVEEAINLIASALSSDLRGG